MDGERKNRMKLYIAPGAVISLWTWSPSMKVDDDDDDDDSLVLGVRL